MRHRYTKGEVESINEFMRRWKEFEHDAWQLISFDSANARFGMYEKGQYIKYVTVNADVIKFLEGVDVDVRDNCDFLV